MVLTAAEEDKKRHRLPDAAPHAVQVSLSRRHSVVVPHAAAEAGELIEENARLVAAGALVMADEEVEILVRRQLQQSIEPLHLADVVRHEQADRTPEVQNIRESIGMSQGMAMLLLLASRL